MDHFDKDFVVYENEKDREFCVRGIPAEVSDWEILHIFKRFGLVENLRFPPNQRPDSRFCFVSMINFEGASNVRAALSSKGKLVVGNTTLRVSDVHTEENFNKQNRHYSISTSDFYFSSTEPCRPQSQKITYSSYDLPTNISVKVQIVPSPFPSDEKEGFTFHLIDTTNCFLATYIELLRDMNTHCHSYENSSGSVEIGTPVIFYRDEVAYRAIQNKIDTIYLVDMGREERIVNGKLFRMLQKFAILPTLVITCSLARIEWKKPSNELFNSVRQIVKKWCDSEGCLTAQLEYFVGSTNMIHLEGNSNTNLAKSLAKRGDLTSYEIPTRFVYHRDEMIRIGNKSNNLLQCTNCYAEIKILNNIAEDYFQLIRSKTNEVQVTNKEAVITKQLIEQEEKLLNHEPRTKINDSITKEEQVINKEPENFKQQIEHAKIDMISHKFEMKIKDSPIKEEQVTVEEPANINQFIKQAKKLVNQKPLIKIDASETKEEQSTDEEPINIKQAKKLVNQKPLIKINATKIKKVQFTFEEQADIKKWIDQAKKLINQEPGTKIDASKSKEEQVTDEEQLNIKQTIKHAKKLVSQKSGKKINVLKIKEEQITDEEPMNINRFIKQAKKLINQKHGMKIDISKTKKEQGLNDESVDIEQLIKQAKNLVNQKPVIKIKSPAF